jgi:Arc/MetJ-type ribon-helix-helix transcriptional regulator
MCDGLYPRSLLSSSASAISVQDSKAIAWRGMIVHHTEMPKTKVALTIDANLLEQVDALVSQQRFRNRSQAIEAALADKLHRLARTRLAREAAKLNPLQEKRLADEGLADALDSWPEY